MALGSFIATFIYALVVLRQVRADEPGGVPALTVQFAVVLVLASVGVFVVFIHHIAGSIRVSSIVHSVAEESRVAIEWWLGDARAPDPAPTDGEPASIGPTRTIAARSAGAVVRVDTERLTEIATRHEAVIALERQIGDFVARGMPLASVPADLPASLDPTLIRHVDLAMERTMEQDVMFGFRQLVDIAQRALSPGVNDPTTAVQAIDHIHDLLRSVADRALPDGRHHDATGALRLFVPQPAWEDLVALAVTEISISGGQQPQVQRRLRAMLHDLGRVVPQERHPALSHELERLDRPSTDQPGRGAVHTPDMQGMGG